MFSLASTVGYARTNVIGSRTLFILAYIEIYVFWGNPYHAHSLEQSYHPTQPFKQEILIQNQKHKCKNNIKVIYLTFVQGACKFE
jgi:hypothetical protein